MVYAGVVDTETVDYVLDDLPSPVAGETYERSNDFETEPLDIPVKESTYGLLVVEHGKATLGRFTDADVEQTATFQSDRKEDNPTSGELGDREQIHREFFERVAEKAEIEFLGEDADDQRKSEANPGQSDIDPVEGVLVGGSSVPASEFLGEEYLDHRLQNRVVTDAFAVGDASREGLEQLADEARGHLEEAERGKIRDLLDEFFAELEAGDEAVSGREATEEALAYEGVATMFASENLPAGELRHFEQRTVSQGGEFVVAPTDVEKGDQFKEERDVGALVRFPVE
ncbi:Vms1/Ankzf1 family peptidyl-tRNA hydrolase [Haladaptatus sp. NG-WS-4]